MKSLVICVSVSNGSTRRVADRMAEVLGAEVLEPEAVDVETLRDYDLVGFGSGIYFMAVHPRLWRLIRRLPRGNGTHAFTFFTSGGPELPLLGYRRAVHRRLTAKGFEVLDSFSCRGLDTVGPLRWVGGVNKGRPDDADLDRAAAFATQLRERVAQSPRAR
ncbi:flavodoxin [Mycolicibacterium fluoranthenivorans]|jgi:flavodoxin|uniref:Flavodoxin n=1 Tax=Mycolicibacterium fluoranthenivorans TaxID=258505 RepID=A0A7G8P8F3_9MYCO|nr:flavodoxin domain-containing protein [Mycolicibacterium fluoranthenivorans]QNJ90619.1 flavodoxin [Mycolicibacterium fluoranthenivorans]